MAPDASDKNSEHPDQPSGRGTSFTVQGLFDLVASALTVDWAIGDQVCAVRSQSYVAKPIYPTN